MGFLARKRGASYRNATILVLVLYVLLVVVSLALRN